jgi:DNA polymerase III gamma/tau subunit
VNYIKRIIDKKLENREKSNIGILITGVKGCGKTETARQFAKSEFVVDNKEQTILMVNSNPKIIIEGEKPRLIDERQLQT